MLTYEEKQLQWAIWQGFFLLILIGLGFVLVFRFGEMIPFLQSLFISEKYSLALQLPAGVAIGLLVGFVTLSLLKWTNTTLPENELADLLRTILSKPVGFVPVVIGAPLVEEFLFRGVFIGLFLDVVPTWILLLVNALLFMLVHVPQYKGMPILHGIIFFVGLLLAYLFIVTGALIVPILVHAVYNLVVGIAMRRMA
ncbi:CPBP family intramembrane glutamic endopeptidase [Shouchella miscanthi]|uniref:CPBP family intramembrane glutamic endopeptidase n=1 Tax=Shouchella miscanthi TaxID=2598861 RepID=UPI0011A5B1B8|nr:type II CAAX endopeptidase family protein [Shouchella miscanthi]